MLKLNLKWLFGGGKALKKAFRGPKEGAPKPPPEIRVSYENIKTQLTVGWEKVYHYTPGVTEKPEGENWLIHQSRIDGSLTLRTFRLPRIEERGLEGIEEELDLLNKIHQYAKKSIYTWEEPEKGVTICLGGLKGASGAPWNMKHLKHRIVAKTAGKLFC